MRTLAVLFALAISGLLLPASADAQRSYDDHYQKPSRFPVLRKAFRQIRSDVRYHAGALRDTASGIRHDVESSIIGPQPEQNRYGYREPEPRYPHYDTPRRNDDYYYEERPAPPRETKRRNFPPYTKHAPRRDRVASDAPKIVAPKDLEPQVEKPIEPQQPAPTIKPQPQPQPKPKPEAKPEQKPAPAPQPKSKPEAKPDKKPVVGKIGYPEAKRSKRPGFHYSPFEPFELLDTRGIGPGELAKDPGNGKIFRIPK